MSFVHKLREKIVRHGADRPPLEPSDQVSNVSGRVVDPATDQTIQRETRRIVISNHRPERPTLPARGKTLIDIDEERLAAAQQALGTTTKKDTVNAALAQAVSSAARRRDLLRLETGALPDLADPDVMASAWRR